MNKTVLKKKVIFLNLDGKRYQYTEIIERFDPVPEPNIKPNNPVTIIDLTNEDEEDQQCDAARSTPHESPCNSLYNTPGNSPYNIQCNSPYNTPFNSPNSSNQTF